MSDIIQLLPDSVANQIAAGEVIQRPASVIKELVENSIDAGATTINVLVVDAGRTSIQVVDDGKGMSETDARLSFERHATSKIRQADDLFALRTMGFRGEALASIAAVAQVELKTRQDGQEVGTHLSVAGSKYEGQEPCQCPVGSNFYVENLFYNVPARRRFLKSNATELNNILSAFERIALVYPQIHFTFHSNGVEVFNLPPGNVRQRILDIFGKRLNQDLLSVNVDTTMCKISGYVGKPESSKKKGAHQYFFVNGRYMKHPYFHKAVMNAYERLVPTGEQVPYFIYFEIAPTDIDVNIHPTKTEIKFENEQAIWQVLAATVKDAIGMFNDVPSIDFDVEGKPQIPVFEADVRPVSAPEIKADPHYNPFHTSHAPQPHRSSSADAVKQWEQLYENVEQRPGEEQNIFDTFTGNVGTESMIDEKSPVHYQYKGQYIMTAVKSGLMIIDQHRAHVRILYQQYFRQLCEKSGASQKVLFPEVIHFSPSEVLALQSVSDEMNDVGFDLVDLGNGSFGINAVPAGMDGVNVVKLVEDIVASAMEKEKNVKENICQSLALNLARHAAIPHGQVLNNDEMENIINGLFACENVNYTPDGKPILCIFQQNEIERLLG